MKRIVIVTSGQPCANPRMVKEAICLSKANFKVVVIYCPISSWGDDFDKIIINENLQIRWIRVGAHPMENPSLYFLLRMYRKVWGLFYYIFGDFFHSSLKSNFLYSGDLQKEAKKHKADLYIGHNLGAIYAVTSAAQHFSSIACFDFEDFHRGEDVENSLHWKRTTEIENKFVYQLRGATSASPLINKHYKNLFPELQFETILNVFPKNNLQSFVDSETERLNIFWFSQTIGVGRGLEFVLSACARVVPQPNFTLLGNCSVAVKDKLIQLAIDEGYDQGLIEFKFVVPEVEIPEIASRHHIGLCTEDPFTLNREFCLTNKIFTYMSSKNALLLSNTLAQCKFLENNDGIGQLVDLKNISQIINCIQYYQDNRILLEKHRIRSLSISQKTYNWEIESQKLLNYYNVLLDNEYSSGIYSAVK